MLKDIIQILSGFQMSVNIFYDLFDEDKIKRFIPTNVAIELIEDIMLSTADNSTDRARMLVGAYGRGKSHIILVLLYLLYFDENSEGLRKYISLFKQAKKYNPDFCNYIVEYKKSKKRLLPVIINGSSLSLNQSFLGALYQSLKLFGIDDIMPNTNFVSVLNTIENWKENYPNTYKTFIEMIDISIEEFISEIKSLSIEAYEKFNKCYPILTSGSVFNPFQGINVLDLYDEVANKISDKGFNGLFVVYDEFSKYLESSIANTTNSDIKLLQDFAEKCNRSKNKQIHLLLISHKDISNYIDEKLSKDKIDGWRGVSGRFKNIELRNNYFQIYDIISYVINKNNNCWESFCIKNKNNFEELKNEYLKSNMFDNKEKDNMESIIYGCYPLHPISSFLLPRISEKVAQNERTLFTFLSSNEKNSLYDFIENAIDKFPLLTPDKIYDYFEPLFRKEPYTSEIYDIYKLANNNLNKLETDSLESKIIKFLALIYILAQFERLAPTEDNIIRCFCNSFDIRDIHKAIENLINDKCIVYLKRSNNYLKLKENSGIDIKGEIEKKVAELTTKFSFVDLLNKYNNNKYLYPVSYNDRNDIVRYFNFSFVCSTDINSDLIKTEADGYVFGVVADNIDEFKEIKHNIENYSSSSKKRTVFIIHKKFENIKNYIFEYAAVKELKETAGEDDILLCEYDLYIEDLEEIIFTYINGYINPEYNKSIYYYNDEPVKNIKRKSHLSKLLSDIYDKVFDKTPNINNELINKNNITSTSISSRNRLINAMLEEHLQKNLGLHGSSQEVSFMRSILVKTGIIQNIDKPEINLVSTDKKITDILNIIREYIISGTKDFNALYKKLTDPEEGIGLKLGVIPVFLAVVIKNYLSEFILIHNGHEINITGEVLSSLNLRPAEYSFRLDSWNENKEKYINQLEALFIDYLIPQEKNSSSYKYLVNAINRWYLSLPKFTKEINKSNESITDEMIKYIKKIKDYNINPREFLFNETLNIFGIKEFNDSVFSYIKDTKSSFDNLFKKLCQNLILEVKHIFTDSNESSLSSALKDWYDGLDDVTKLKLFDNNENAIFDIIKNSDNNEETLIKKLGKTVSGLRIEDWTDKTASEFILSINSIKNKIDTVNSSNTESQNINSYKLEFTDADGNKTVKTIDKTDFSKRAKLLYNDISSSIEEMGQSITENEKRQVLIQILEKLC